MTFLELWQQLCRKQPALESDAAKVEFTSENLRTLLRQVYEQGQKSVPAAAKSTNPFEQLFGR